jgi:hypothetical protein
MNDSGARSLPEKLRWCVGKFVYVRGATTPIHFMELKRFIIDDAVDFSHLFYLRGQRLRASGKGEVDDSLAQWMQGTAVKPVGEALVHVLAGLPQDVPVTEFYPGVGLILEYAKLLLRRQGRGNLPPYLGCRPEAARNKFLVLHERETSALAYRSDADARAVLAEPGPHVALYNHEQTIRLDAEPRLAVADFIDAVNGSAVISVRTTTDPQDQWHTTVKGRVLQLPALQGLLERCGGRGRWNYRFIRDHDAGFLLPDSGAANGLLIAYTADARPPLEGYEPI